MGRAQLGTSGSGSCGVTAGPGAGAAACLKWALVAITAGVRPCLPLSHGSLSHEGGLHVRVSPGQTMPAEHTGLSAGLGFLPVLDVREVAH